MKGWEEGGVGGRMVGAVRGRTRESPRVSMEGGAVKAKGARVGEREGGLARRGRLRGAEGSGGGEGGGGEVEERVKGGRGREWEEGGVWGEDMEEGGRGGEGTKRVTLGRLDEMEDAVRMKGWSHRRLHVGPVDRWTIGGRGKN